MAIMTVRLPSAPDEQKYASRNPVVRALIDRWLGRLCRAVGEDAAVMVDVGTGEGFALERYRGRTRSVIGVDIDMRKIARATRALPAVSPVVADGARLPIRDGSADVVTCVEVLEHVGEPGAVVAELARITGHRCVVSVPWEPWFRFGNLARGRNVGRLGSDPDHVRAFRAVSLRHLLARRFDEIEIHRAFPWLIAVATRPRSAER